MIIFSSSCTGGKNENPIVLPADPPLSRNLVGYGVITASYPHVLNAPDTGGISQGYVRRGSIFPVSERRLVKEGRVSVSWVLVGGSSSGWLREEFIEIYDTESQAKTASELLK